MTHLALVYKDLALWTGYSSVGLQVAAQTTAEVLNHGGISTTVVGVRHNIDLLSRIRNASRNQNPYSHIVIMAPWLTPLDLAALLRAFPKIQFAVQAHSNVGGVHGDVRGIANFRQYADLILSYPNLKIAGNCKSFVDWFARAYDVERVFLLPNLYPLSQQSRKQIRGAIIHIGAFGALRPEKNFITATAAAIEIQKTLDQPVALHMLTGGESGGRRIADTIAQMTDGIPGFTVARCRWTEWSEFRKLVCRMDLLLQPSYTESFNLVTADGIAEGVPSVVSDAIVWAPATWKAPSDSPSAIARIGIRLIRHPKIWIGRDALHNHNKQSLVFWREFLMERCG